MMNIQSKFSGYDLYILTFINLKINDSFLKIVLKLQIFIIIRLEGVL